MIGIAGGSGSGKTTFARILREVLGEDRCLIVEQDAYYFDHSANFDHDGGSVNFDHPDAIDWQLMIEQLNQCGGDPTSTDLAHRDFQNFFKCLQAHESAEDEILERGFGIE